jgi:hypothetical protein
MVYSFDRLRHWAILFATAPLPHRARVSLRHRLLTALERSMLRNADVLFIRHPKTGGTWLRVMLAHLYWQKYGTSIRRVFKADELYRQNPRLPRWLITSGRMSWARIVAEAFERDDPMLKRKRILFLARHPGDVAVSWHLQLHKRTKPFKLEMLEADGDWKVDPRGLSLGEFLREPSAGLQAMIDFHNFWMRMLLPRDNALIVRYEDLLEDAPRELRRIAAHLGEHFSDEQIHGAVAFARKDNLGSLEQSNFFSNPSLRLRDAADPDTRKVRRARRGGYREDLSADQAQWVDRMIAEHLHPALGYAPDAAPSGRPDALDPTGTGL